MKSVKYIMLSGLLALLFSGRISTPVSSDSPMTAEDDNLVYADFEKVQDNRPVSNRGGYIQINTYSESPTMKSRFKGPELVRLKKDDPNHALAFDYELLAPNQYAGVGVEVHGRADEDGKPVGDDVTGFKYLSLQIYATGVTSLRLEFTSRGLGIKNLPAYPQTTFKVGAGFNTYKISLNSLAQPSWVDTRVNLKEVLKQLTSVSLTAYCEQCRPISGTVVVDNIIFIK
ncbi:MAG: hypothetical protein AB1757_11560 [Acidobacteriota bacterium]